MSIVMWEIHVESKRTIAGILEYFKSKGVAVDYKMCKEGHGMISLKHPQRTEINNFNVKLYKELGGTYIYEIGAWSSEEDELMEEWFKDV